MLQGSCLIVEDEPVQREILVAAVSRLRLDTAWAGDGETAMAAIDRRSFDLILLDLGLPHLSGLEVLRRIAASAETGPTTIVTTADQSVRSVVEAMRLGAYDYLTKPIASDRLEVTLSNALAAGRRSRELGYLKRELHQGDPRTGFLGKSPTMEAVFERIAVAGPAEGAVLITGETGTGKELVARALHDASSRDGRFIAVNCAGVPEALLQSELFGHVKGAFTGADRATPGLMQAAKGGTLFLDDIQLMPHGMQSALLRAVEQQRVRPVGSVEEVPTDFRLVAATNVDMMTLIDQERFRADLYYRLAALPVRVPPLRDRGDDVLLLANHFLQECSQESKEFGQDAVEWLIRHDWPGNVRELRNVVYQAVTFSTDRVLVSADLDGIGAASRTEGYQQAREAFERRYFSHLLSSTGGSVREAAIQAGLNRQYVYRKLRSLGLRADPASSTS